MAKVSAKQKILQSAQMLMVSHGYSATSVDEIVRHAGVAKGSFYHAFESKEDLAIAALEDYEQRGWAMIAQGPYASEPDPVQRLLQFLDFIEAAGPAIWEHGCLVGTIAIEVYNSYPKMISRIDELFEDFEDNVAAILEPALAARHVTAVSAKQLALHFMAVVEGSIIAARSHQKAGHLAEGLGHFKRYVKLLLGE